MFNRHIASMTEAQILRCYVQSPLSGKAAIFAGWAAAEVQAPVEARKRCPDDKHRTPFVAALPEQMRGSAVIRAEPTNTRPRRSRDLFTDARQS